MSPRNAYSNDALLKLTVGEGGTASGRFVSRAAFMWLRQDRVLLGPLRDYVQPGDRPDRMHSELDPRQVFGAPDGDFAVATRLRDCAWYRANVIDGSGEFTVWLLGLSGERSWASIDFEGGPPSRSSSTDSGGCGTRSRPPTGGGRTPAARRPIGSG